MILEAATFVWSLVARNIEYHRGDRPSAHHQHAYGQYPSKKECVAAARELALDLSASFAIGDKKSDVAAGRAAGCRTILLRTGHAGRGEAELAVEPDAVADDLAHAADLIAHWPVLAQSERS